MSSTCVVDLRPRWVVVYRRSDLSFQINFNQMDDMLTSILNAKAIGFAVKVFQAKGNAD